MSNKAGNWRGGFPQKKTPTQKSRRAALLSLVTLRENLETVSIQSLSRSYGLPEEEVVELVEAEKEKRKGRK